MCDVSTSSGLTAPKLPGCAPAHAQQNDWAAATELAGSQLLLSAEKCAELHFYCMADVHQVSVAHSHALIRCV
jgi:hypothetical protein